MCAIDDADRCDIWNVSDVKAARKPTTCTECRRDIAAGEPYRRIESLFEGEWTTTRLCAHCRVGAEWLNKECGGHLIDGVRQDIHEHAAEYSSFGLWRLVVGMDRKWRRKDGAIMPVPSMPRLSAGSAR